MALVVSSSPTPYVLATPCQLFGRSRALAPAVISAYTAPSVGHLGRHRRATKHRCRAETTTTAGGLPPPALEGTRWSLQLDIGRTRGTLMPSRWATQGSRLSVPILVEFCEGGELEVREAGSFVGEWREPPSQALGITEMGPFTILRGTPPLLDSRPSLSNGRWNVLKDGREVEFYVETSGFRREELWLPETKLRFRAAAYGKILARGTSPTIMIREDLSVLGASMGFFAGIMLGPVLCLASAALAGFRFREVPVAVGRWSCERVEDEDTVRPLPLVRMVTDEPGTWQ